MVYNYAHKREVRGEQVHETLNEKKKCKKLKKEEEVTGQTDFSLSETTKGEVEAKYLVPKVEKWVETPSVKVLKEKLKSWVSLNYPIHLVGPTGCGKTILALQVAKELGRPVVWINGDESVTTTDLIGGYSQVETTTLRDKFIHNVFKDKDILKAEWVDNPLTLACKYGYTLIYNEFSRSRAAANNVLLSIFSEGILELPTQFGEERYVKVHPDFRAIFTSNSIEYAGIHKPQDALLDRMVGIHMGYHDKETEAEIIATHSKLNKHHALIITDMLSTLRKKRPESCIGTRAGIMVARAMPKEFDKTTAKELLVDAISSKTKNLEDLRHITDIITKL